MNTGVTEAAPARAKAVTPAAIRSFYDRFGRLQDRQRFYEDRALDDLVAHVSLGEARQIVEFGCGTGRFASRILARFPRAAYRGFDVSTTMAGLARRALEPFGNRASVGVLEPGTILLPVPDHSADRVLSTYVLDLLHDGEINAFFAEARRVLAPRGLLGVVSLTSAASGIPRVVASLWRTVHDIRPGWVGFCRPIHLAPRCAELRWEVVHERTLAAWGVPSEVLVVRPRRD